MITWTNLTKCLKDKVLSADFYHYSNKLILNTQSHVILLKKDIRKRGS